MDLNYQPSYRLSDKIRDVIWENLTHGESLTFLVLIIIQKL